MKTLKQELTEKLYSIFGAEDLARRWWGQPNFHFGLRTPEEVFKTNKKEVIKYIERQFL